MDLLKIFFLIVTAAMIFHGGTVRGSEQVIDENNCGSQDGESQDQDRVKLEHYYAAAASSRYISEPTSMSFFSMDHARLLGDDIKHILTAPARWEKKEWTTFSFAVLGLGAAALLDGPIWDTMKDHRSHTANRVADVTSEFTGVYSVAVLVPFYTAGKFFHNEKAVNVALDGWAASLVAAGIISSAMKFIASRSPPDHEAGTHDFSFFSYRFEINGGRQSFPSGHAIQGFAVASVIAGHYEEPWIKIAAYGIASLGGATRLC